MFAVFPFMRVPFINGLTQVAFNVDNDSNFSQTQPSLSKPINAQPTANDNASFTATFQKFSQAKPITQYAQYQWESVEKYQVDWLINQFNRWFADKNTQLVRGDDEPEYFAPTLDTPAKIVFAHGFFASSLHEISHWCVAGKQRRQLNDFGYWYAPDGRNAQQQQAFEQVEIKPQAIECLLTLSCGKRFRVSQDNLSADFDTQASHFAEDVCQQALSYWQTGEKLPTDAKRLLRYLQPLCPFPVTATEICQNFFKR